MDRIDFDARIENGGIIRVPEEYIKKLGKNEDVHVTLDEQSPERGTVKLMREHPLDAPNLTPLKRDQLYDRAR